MKPSKEGAEKTGEETEVEGAFLKILDPVKGLGGDMLGRDGGGRRGTKEKNGRDASTHKMRGEEHMGDHESSERLLQEGGRR